MAEIDMILYNIDMDKLDFSTCDLRISLAHKTYCHSAWSWCNDAVADRFGINLWLVAKGTGVLESRRGTFDLVPGDCLLVRHCEPHVSATNSDDPFVIPYVVFECLDERGEPFMPADESLPVFYRHLDNQTIMLEMLERSIMAVMAGNHVTAIHWLRSCMLELGHWDNRPDRSGLELEQFEQIAKVRERVQQNPAACRVEELAADMGYTPDHFIRVFRKIAGVTPGEYLIQCRITSAQGLLRQSSHSVGQIAELLGYCDIYAFSKQFRKRTGMSPSGYRKRR